LKNKIQESGFRRNLTGNCGDPSAAEKHGGLRMTDGHDGGPSFEFRLLTADS
jgi:hypothetical protein